MTIGEKMFNTTKLIILPYANEFSKFSCTKSKDLDLTIGREKNKVRKVAKSYLCLFKVIRR